MGKKRVSDNKSNDDNRKQVLDAVLSNDYNSIPNFRTEHNGIYVKKIYNLTQSNISPDKKIVITKKHVVSNKK